MKCLRIIMALVMLVTAVPTAFAEGTDLLPPSDEVVAMENETVSEEVIAEGDEETTVAPETEDVVDNKDVEVPENSTNKFKTIVDGMKQGTKININVESRKFSTVVKHELMKDITEEQNEGMLKFLTGLSDIYNSGEKNQFLRPTDNKYDYYVDIEITLPNKEDFYVTMYDNVMFMFGNEAHMIENSEDVINHIYNSLCNEISYLTDYPPNEKHLGNQWALDFENMTFIGYSPLYDKYNPPAPMSLKEKLTFDLNVDDTYYDTHIGEIADSGEVLHCTIEQYFIHHPTFILTMKGSKGTKKFFCVEAESTFNGSTTLNRLDFLTNSIVEDNKCNFYNHSTNRDRIAFEGKTSNGNISEITMSFYIDNMGKSSKLKEPSDLKAYNIKYEFYGTDSYFNSDRNLIAKFGIPLKRPADFGEIKPDVAEDIRQEMRETNEKKTEVTDFKVDFVGNVKLPDVATDAEDWTAKLGDNIEMSIMSITPTKNGEAQASYPMIRFKGSKGIQWFDIDTIRTSESPKTQQYPDKLNEDVVYMKFKSMEFDGFTKVKNTVNYYPLVVILSYEDRAAGRLDSIDFEFAGESMSIDARDINYFGGGKIGRKTWW